MKWGLIFFFLIVLGGQAISQIADDFNFGTDTTLDVVTWNIEWFPKNGQTTADYVKEIIEKLDADVLAIQEVDDTVLFKQVVNNLDGYQCYLESSYFAGLAYVYKNSTVEINSIKEIYTSYSYWSAFPRSPVVMNLTFKGENYYIINNHFKCCGDGILNINDSDDEETRRYNASNLLKQYVDSYRATEKVITVGDFNDVLTDNVSNNVFQNILNDTINFLFADMDIAKGNESDWSYPGWPSHLDHILITNELFDYIAEIKTIKIDEYLSGGFNEYDDNVSDHRPVGIRISQDVSSGLSEIAVSKTKIYNYPNPFNSSTTIVFHPVSDKTDLSIFNMNGEKVYSEKIANGVSQTEWNAEYYPAGVYFVQLLSGDGIIGKARILLVK